MGKWSVVILGVLLLSACGDKSKERGRGSNVQAPKPYCSDVQSIPSGVQITGTAQYQYRSDGNGPVAGPNPIRYAEVQIINEEGQTVQCGHTAADGTFALTVPTGSKQLQLSVNSRGYNNVIRAYILSDPTSNQHYSLTKSFTPSSDQDLGTLLAKATGDVLGGAFNIFDQLVSANIFLKNETNSGTTCSSLFTGCVDFDVSKTKTAMVYWKKGFSPGEYVGSGMVSFYLPGEYELYILGGANGDVDNMDTDHFDNSVILHEYAHYLEDIFGMSDSPGGQHNGDSIIDPRLAWSEGWANYFQAAVTGLPVYRDTGGTTLGVPKVYFNEDIESGTLDTPDADGEGIFHEFSIARLFWDVSDSNEEDPSIDDLPGFFREIWAVFTNATLGMKNSSNAFRSANIFHHYQQQHGGDDWSTLRAAEKHPDGREHYATPLKADTCAPITLTDDDTSDNGPFVNSNLFHSNDFYRYDHPGGALNITLNYTTDAGNVNRPADLDLYLYTKKYTYGNTGHMVAYSDDTIPYTDNSDSEVISLASLKAGTYMINVKLYTGRCYLRAGNSNQNGDDCAGTRTLLAEPADYEMTINGTQMCPDL